MDAVIARRGGPVRVLLLWSLLFALAGILYARDAVAGQAVDGVEARDAALWVNHREVMKFSVALLDAERARRAASALQRVLLREGPGRVEAWGQGDNAGLKVDGDTVFYVLPGDAASTDSTPVDLAGQVQARLQRGGGELRERRDAGRVGAGLAWTAAASVLAAVALNRLFWVRCRTGAALTRALHRRRAARPSGDLFAGYADSAHALVALVGKGICWGVVLLLADLRSAAIRLYAALGGACARVVSRSDRAVRAGDCLGRARPDRRTAHLRAGACRLESSVGSARTCRAGWTATRVARYRYGRGHPTSGQ
ncbi:hypothetical protein [Methyloversatilis thermotolerans]|uniref:hypothetical protein n=1 Tax=Methyloversatilis thermotolerans TaxID=1346290 RepID=UPI000381D22E|nr:hypothetical protein [Methyloversatilis thermotolerans]